MNQALEVQNAKITSTSLGVEDHGIFTAWLTLDYGGGGQSFGGFALDTWDEARKKRIGSAYGMEFIARILETLEVATWEKLPGTVCRVRAQHTSVEEIGHFLKDKWFNPRALADEILVAIPKQRRA